MRDHAVSHAKRIFARLENEGIRTIERKNGLFVIEFSGRQIGIDGFIWTRLKKLNESLLTSNIGTKQANAFNSQTLPAYQTQPSLIGEPEKVFYPAAVNYGYTANATFTHYCGLYATLQTGRQCLGWFKKISKNDDDFGLMGVSDSPPQDNQKIVAFPVAVEIEQPQRRVRAKGTKTEDTEIKKTKISE